jgi:hypothetical protein
MVRALEAASPASAELAGLIAGSQRILRLLSQLLCSRLRSNDLAGAWDVTRLLLGYFLYGRSLARRSLSVALHGMNLRALRRFAKAPSGRMLVDLAAGRTQADPASPPDRLQALYGRLMRHLQIRPSNSELPGVNHEHSCRR